MNIYFFKDILKKLRKILQPLIIYGLKFRLYKNEKHQPFFLGVKNLLLYVWVLNFKINFNYYEKQTKLFSLLPCSIVKF